MSKKQQKRTHLKKIPSFPILRLDKIKSVASKKDGNDGYPKTFPVSNFNIMKEIVKEHPLRPIILRFDMGKPQLDFEKKGLETHYLMHDLTWDISQKLKEHNQALEEIDFEIAELEYLLLPIEQDLDILEVFLKIKDPSVLPFDKHDEGTEISIDLENFYKEVIYHNQRVQDLHDDISKEYQWFNAHFEMIYEKESWIDENLWNDIHLIYKNYLEAQVDIVSLDRDQEEFKTVLAEVNDLQDSYHEYGEVIFNSFNALQTRSEECYKRAEIVNKGLDELNKNAK